MNIVWLSWKDRGHPLAGGAEKVSGEIMDRLASNGHSVRLLTAQYDGSMPHQKITDNFEIFRSGNRYTVYLKARALFRKQADGWADVVIDEMNTLPFWSGFYARSSINVLLSYQLAREVWFYQMIFPLSLIGYTLEPLMLRVLSKGNYKAIVTESESSKKDIERYGFSKVQTFRVGIPTPPLQKLPIKSNPSLVLCLGALRPMKRTLEAVKAFEFAHSTNPSLRMVIAGDSTSSYGKKVADYIKDSSHRGAIEVKGRVTNEERLHLMREAAVILVTSIKEGWGLIVTEANSQGTPAIVYDVDGLRDSVQADITGVVVSDGDHKAMGIAVNTLLSDTKLYDTYRRKAWKLSRQYTFENSYEDFMKIIEKAYR